VGPGNPKARAGQLPAYRFCRFKDQPRPPSPHSLLSTLSTSTQRQPTTQQPCRSPASSPPARPCRGGPRPPAPPSGSPLLAPLPVPTCPTTSATRRPRRSMRRSAPRTPRCARRHVSVAARMRTAGRSLRRRARPPVHCWHFRQHRQRPPLRPRPLGLPRIIAAWAWLSVRHAAGGGGALWRDPAMLARARQGGTSHLVRRPRLTAHPRAPCPAVKRDHLTHTIAGEHDFAGGWRRGVVHARGPAARLGPMPPGTPLARPAGQASPPPQRAACG